MNTGGTSFERRRALTAVALLVPAPTIGALLAMHVEPTAGTRIGAAAYIAAKVWILTLPLIWLLRVERGRLSLSPPRHGGLGVGVVLGLVMAGAILAAGLLLVPDVLDPQMVRGAAEEGGFATPLRFLALAAYICTINALLEEYVWRWFVFRQCERIMARAAAPLAGWLAVLLSAGLFTAHHVVVLLAQAPAPAVVLGSLGVFVAGAVWSWCYLRYRSVWPGFLSHAIADVAIFIVGWRLIFGM